MIGEGRDILGCGRTLGCCKICGVGVTCVAVGGTLGSAMGLFGGTLSSNMVSEASDGGLKSEARWRSCFRVSVLTGGSNVEWDLERRAAVRSFTAAAMISSCVADGILQ